MESKFFAVWFDLIGMMQGTYEVGRISSFHVTGTAEWEQGQANLS